MSELGAHAGLSPTAQRPRAGTLPRSKMPGVYTNIAPAWNDSNLFNLSEKIRSSCIFAHVRAASLGSPVTTVNCHPFAAAQYMFMHNGFLCGFDRLRKQLVQAIDDSVFHHVQGTSDSSHCFGLFLTEVLKEGPLSSSLSPLQLQGAMSRTLARLEEMCAANGVEDGSMLNFCVTDGATVLATKHVIGKGPAASLYLACGSGWEADDEEEGVFRMARRDRREEVVIVASERLTAEAEDWISLPRNHMVVVTEALNVLMVPTSQQAMQDALQGAGQAVLVAPTSHEVDPGMALDDASASAAEAASEHSASAVQAGLMPLDSSTAWFWDSQHEASASQGAQPRSLEAPA